MTQTHYRLPFVCAADSVKFARLHLKRAAVEMLGHDIHAGRITYKDDAVGKLFGK